MLRDTPAELLDLLNIDTGEAKDRDSFARCSMITREKLDAIFLTTDRRYLQIVESSE
jgi:hypothetical protein